MNQFKNIPFIDVDEFDFIGFTLVKIGNQYNVDMCILCEGKTNGLIIRTSIYGESIMEVGLKIRKMLSSGVYDHLGLATKAMCYTEYGEVEFEFDFDDYLDLGDYDSDDSEDYTGQH